jgi:hypothetical protein
MLNVALLPPVLFRQENGFTLDRVFGFTEAGAFHLFDLFIGLVLSTLLTYALVQSYRATHRGALF